MNKKLLVVDDDCDYLHVVCLYLSAYYEVAAASGVDEAIGLLRRDGADLVLIDLAMPAACALDFVARLSVESPERRETPVVVMTAASVDHLPFEVLSGLGSRGVRRLIEKPLSLLELQREVAATLSAARS